MEVVIIWDLVVIGAGPAGASAALAARRERPAASVLLLDRAAFPRDKSCGDGIAPHALDVLDTLGAPTTFAGHPPVTTLELSNGGVGVVREMRRPALVVPRSTFDASLVSAALSAGARLQRCRVKQIERQQGCVLINGHIVAKAVVAADGARSVVRQSVGGRGLAAGKVAMALRGYAPISPERAHRQVIRFGQTRQPSYAWSFDRGDGWANVGYGEVLHAGRFRTPLTRSLMIEQVEQMLPGSTAGARDWLGHHLPLSAPHFSHPGGRILYAGDAASLINPLTGEGIYYAVATGALAGVCSVSPAPPEAGARTYRNSVRRLLGPHLGTTAAVSRLVGAPALLNTGLHAAAADQGVFDDLVEIGLGRGVFTRRLVRGLVRHIG